MKRREALSTLSVIAGGSMILPQTFLSGCDRGPYPYPLFDWGDMELLNDIAGIIIPDTPDVPGARAANVGDFIQLYVTDCYRAVDQKAFLDGYKEFKLSVKTRFNEEFIDLDPEDKVMVLEKLEEESMVYQQDVRPDEPGHFYGLLKSTVLFGYFTSEIGATKALRYVPIPGYQKGEIPYNGEKVWAL